MKLGIIGLGRMGSALAERFATQGHAVTGWTRSGLSAERAAQLGIGRADSIANLVVGADVILTSLFDDTAVAEVLDALLACAISGKLIVETSTVVPTLLTERSAAFVAAGADVVDAPISGGPEMVRAGTCGVFIGGSDDAATRADAALAALTQRRRHVGPLGAGMAMKTINNGVSQAYFAGLVEMLRLGKRAGLELDTILDELRKSPAGLPMIMARIPKILGDDTDVGFTLSGVCKDNAVFQTVAAAFDVDTPALRAADAVQRAAMEDGIGDDQDAAMMFAKAYRDA